MSPSLFRRLSASRLPLAVSAALGLILLAAVMLAAHVWRAAKAHRVAAEAALQEYATFAAWTYRYRAEANHYFVATRVFGAVGGIHPDRPAPRTSPAVILAAVADLKRCNCAPIVTSRFAFRVDLEGGDLETAGSSVPEAPALGRRLELVRQHCKQYFGPVDWAVASGEDEGVPWVIFYTLQRDARTKRGTIYGFEVDLESLQQSIYGSIFEREPLLPVVRATGVPINAGLAVRVVNGNGAALYQTPAALSTVYSGQAYMLRGPAGPDRAIRVNTSIDPAAADQLLIGGLPRSPMPLVLTLVIATLALVVVAGVFTWKSAELVRVREEFTSSVTHELRTPLTQILLYAELLSFNRMRSVPERRGALDVIIRESRRLIHLVENVLQLSVASRRSGLATRLQPLAPIIEEVLTAFEPQLRSRSVSLQRAIDGGINAQVNADALRQVLINFLDNAARYGPESQTVTVGVDVSGAVARVWVRDQGPGVPPDDRERIWRPFVRLARSDAGGSGIGLAVVQHLVDLQGGRCGVEAPPGGGSVFFAEFNVESRVLAEHSREQGA